MILRDLERRKTMMKKAKRNPNRRNNEKEDGKSQ
jgi:hypothetical protein